MKKIFLFLALTGIADLAVADQYVHGYVKNNGTYVQPHYRTTPDSTTTNNYSTQGNINPYTSQPGYKPAYPTQQMPVYSTPQQPTFNRVPQYNPNTGLYE